MAKPTLPQPGSIRRSIMLLTVILMLFGFACSVTRDPPPTASDMSAEQQAAIADGAISSTEYRAAFERFRQCLADLGYELKNIDYKGKIIQYAIPDQAVSTGVERNCYLREFEKIDIGWQLGNPSA